MGGTLEEMIKRGLFKRAIKITENYGDCRTRAIHGMGSRSDPRQSQGNLTGGKFWGSILMAFLNEDMKMQLSSHSKRCTSNT